MIQQNWDKGKLVSIVTLPDPPPDPRKVAIAKAIADLDATSTVAGIKTVLQAVLGALALALFMFLSGCGMFGDTAFYQAMGQACMKCHAGGGTPTKQNLKPETGIKGEAGTKVPGCLLDCPYANGR